MSTSVPLQSPTPSAQAGDPSVNSASDLKVRLCYGLFLVVGFILGVICQYGVADWVLKWAINHDNDCSSDACVGTQAAYRISFALFLFFFGHYLMSHSCNCCLSASQRVSFNRPGMFLVRIIVLAILFVVAFFIPNTFFTYFAWFALVVSCFYLVGQLVLLLHFAYGWGEDWRNREENKFTYGLLFATVVLYVGGLVFIAYLFKWFGNDASCSTGQGILVVTLLGAVLYTVLCLVVPHGSLLPSGVVFLYSVWLAYSGLSSGIAPGTCNTVDSTSTTQMIVGAVVSALSLAVAATNAGTSRDALTMDADDGEATEEAVAANGFQFFHLMMMMGSCYLAMLLSSWAITGSSGIVTSTNSGTASMWVKLGSELLCLILYVWTLVAPKLFPDRDFG